MKQPFILIVTWFILCNLHAQAQTQGDLIQSATEAYSKEDYKQATELYSEAINLNGESAIIYYNIGNCYYKLNNVAQAILHYERALLLEPGNNDIRFNLEVAKLKTVDKFEPVDRFFVVEWMESLQNLFSTNQWAYAGLGSFFLLITCLVLFFFSRKIGLKKTGFYLGIVMLVVCIASNSFSYRQKEKLVNRKTAIILTPTVTIKSSPDNSGTDLFILHEGSKVTIKDQVGNWCEIKNADGSVGWIKNTDLEVI